MPGFEFIGKEEKEAVEEVFNEGGVLFAHGFDKLRKRYHVREFERSVATYFGCQHALAVSSGTAAIKIALKAIGVGKNDEVITQAFNFIATIEAIIDCGAKPIIANVDETLNLDPDELQKLINKKTKAIIPVHMLGISAKLNEIREIAQSQGNIPIVEDNCEAIGATYQNKKLGTIGELGVLSFDQGKMIATGEGGMILTNDPNFDRIAREYHDHGHENNPLLPRGRDTRTKPGFNYRMTELQAAIGKVQLSKLDKMLAENKKRYMVLQKNLSKEFKIRGTPSDSEASWDTLIVFEENHKRRDQFIKILHSEGFGTKNLPDAMEWHCSKFWNHALPKKQILRGNKTHKILETAIAIPIWLRKSITEYENLAKKLIET